MRLIEADAVVKAIDKHTFDTDDGLCLDEDITCILEEVPTIGERKTGQWIYKYLGFIGFTEAWEYRCSECGALAYDENDNFCPHCGADMRKAKFDEKRGKHE